jgi:hypothetical protein
VKPAIHLVYMIFTRGRGWACEFTEESTRTVIRHITVATPDTLRETVERGGALSNQEASQALEYGITTGRGAVTLKLTGEQLAKLKAGR